MKPKNRSRVRIGPEVYFFAFLPVYAWSCLNTSELGEIRD
jgi:hypothetical protein